MTSIKAYPIRLPFALAERGMNAKDLAKITGMDYAYTTRIVFHSVPCGIKSAHKIATALGKNVTDLFEIK